jgi:hypothetical protein
VGGAEVVVVVVYWMPSNRVEVVDRAEVVKVEDVVDYCRQYKVVEEVVVEEVLVAVVVYWPQSRGVEAVQEEVEEIQEVEEAS